MKGSNLKPRRYEGQFLAWFFPWLFLTLILSAYLFWRVQPLKPSFDQLVFLVGFVSACTWIWITWALGLRAGIENAAAGLPGWCKSAWAVRLVWITLYSAFGMGLELLDLPAFYREIFRFSIIMMLGLFAFAGKSQSSDTQTFRVENAFRKATLGRELTFRPNPLAPLFLVGASVAASFFGISCLHGQIQGFQQFAWPLIMLGGLGTLAGSAILLPGYASLNLKHSEFSYVYQWRRYSFAWAQVTNFTVCRSRDGNKERVGWNMRNLEVAKAFRSIKFLYGRDAILPAKFGVDPADLCRLMQLMRTKSVGDDSLVGAIEQ